MDTTSYFAGNSDKCPKCGAAKVFSALRCPACGTEYAAAAPNRSAGGANAGFTSTSASNFDLNASFSAYKKSIEPQAEAAEVAAVGAAAGIAVAGVAGAANTSAQDGDSVLSNIAELDKPAELDPIARKLQEMSKQNSAPAPNGNPAPMPGVYIPGASNRSSSYQGSQAQNNHYQGVQPQGTSYQSAQQSNAPAPGVWYPGMPAQNNAGQGTSYQGGAGQASSSQGSAPQGMRFQGRPDINHNQQLAGQSGAREDGATSPYASPYSGASYGSGITETDNSGKVGKILRVVILLALLGVVVYGVYRLYNSDKNEKGLPYSAGRVENDMYVSDWAELKIDLTKGVSDYSSMINDPGLKSSVNSLNRSLLDQNAEVKAEFMAAKQFKDFDTKTITVMPAIMVFTITDNDIMSKIFGTKVEKFFYEFRTSGGGPYTAMSLSKSSDIVLSGHAYKTFVTSMNFNTGDKVNMYMCVRAIGNKMVLIYLYEIPGYYDLNTLKSYFID